MAETVFSNLRVRGTLTLVGLTTLVTAVITTLTVTTLTVTTGNVRTFSGSLLQVQNGAALVEATTLSGVTLAVTTANATTVNATTVEASHSGAVTMVNVSTTAGDLLCFKSNGVVGRIARANTGSLATATCL